MPSPWSRSRCPAPHPPESRGRAAGRLRPAAKNSGPRSQLTSKGWCCRVNGHKGHHPNGLHGPLTCGDTQRSLEDPFDHQRRRQPSKGVRRNDLSAHKIALELPKHLPECTSIRSRGSPVKGSTHPYNRSRQIKRTPSQASYLRRRSRKSG